MLSAVLALSLVAPPVEPNVIFLTCDGVRWQDFSQRSAEPSSPTFWSRPAATATMLRGPQIGEPFLGRSRASQRLPAYQEMMLGRAVGGGSTRCGRVRRRTRVGALASLGLGHRVKVVASRGTINDA